ncbi:YqjF family protein [Flavobacterium sp. JP2137]|uniref:YqjF family protein n=1 Tax=Flavobacterium sp. JP2137 TaxID=3414510 RepID=UPI003D2FF609
MNIKKILTQVDHRPWALPTTPWVYYQEWNEVCFMHWKVDSEALEKLLPPGVALDLFEGEAWVSLVPFTMERIRPSFLPAFAPISNFHEINLRTYVVKDGKPGVYFLNIESAKWLSTLLAKKLSGLPYENASISRKTDGNQQLYSSLNTLKGFRISARFTTSARKTAKSPLEIWLTERYCLYVDQGAKLYCYDIHHLEWELEEVTLQQLTIDYQIGGIALQQPPHHLNYSKGIRVVAWDKELLDWE